MPGFRTTTVCIKRIKMEHKLKSLFMKSLQFALLLALLSISLFAQAQYREGYMITLDKDTLHGQVYYRMNSSAYDVCKFQDAQGTKVFTPHEISGFGFTDDAFFSSRFIDGLFVEVLLAGRITMFKHKNNLYLKKEGYDYFPIDNEKMTMVNNHKVKSPSKWRGLLTYMTSDCNSGSFDFANNTGQIRELILALQTYHTCINEPHIEYKSNRPWTRFEPGIFVGAGISAVEIQPTEFMDGRYNPTTPLFGVQLTITSPRITDLLALEIHASLSSTSIHSLVVREVRQSTLYHESLFSSSMLTTGANLRYALFNKRLQGFVHLGMQYYRHFYDLTIHTDELRNNWVTPFVQVPGTDVSSDGYVLNGGISVMYKFPFFQAGLGVFYSPSLIANDIFISTIDNYSVRLILSR
jgi:hypothetical protein